jgi:hypothetical protein
MNMIIKKTFNKFILSIITLILVVFTLGTSTFAWFSLSDTNEVSDINITVGGGEELLVSLNGTDFYSVLPANVFMNYIKGKNGDRDLSLRPVTSTDGRTVKNLNGDVLKTVEDGVNVYFIKLNIYFRANDINDSKAEKNGLGVYLNDFNYDVTFKDTNLAGGTYIVSKGIRARAEVDFTDYDVATGEPVDINSSDVVTKYASDAVRVAFFDNQYTFYGSQDLATSYYDLSYRNRTELYNYGYGYGYSSSIEDLKGAASFYYEKTRNMLTPETLKVPVRHPSNGFTTFGEADKALYPNSPEGFICYLTPYDIGKYEGYMTMLIWLEGYDPDCYNVIANDEIVISLSFRLGYKENKD